MHKIYLYTFLLVLSVTCFSCDNRWVFKGENLPPGIGFKLLNGEFTDEEGNLLISLSDTLKLNNKVANDTYSFEMKYFDDNLLEIAYEILKGEGSLLQLNVEEQLENKIDISEEEVTLQYIPQELGEHEISFIATDIFGEKSPAISVFLYFFDNWLPVGELQISYQGKTDPRHYLLDAGKSIDQDEAYGGGISQYKFIINEYEFLTTTASINYIFQANGTFNVGLQVMDNDGVWSEVVSEEVVVEQ